jgi:bacillopeptidase F (M6 metalloprotease family)
MKTKTTFRNALISAAIALLLLFSFNAKAQTHVYDDVTASGIFFDGNGSEVLNPVSDAINSSTTCANSGTDGSWQKMQFFPTYTPVAGDLLFISVYNPNSAGPGQVQFEYTSNPGTWQWGGNLEYGSDSLTVWVEYTLDLTSHAGNEINKVIVMPAGASASAAYVDNIYFGTVSVIPVPESPIVYNDTVASGIFFDGNGSEVLNPVSDAVNSSETCANTGDAGAWQKLQFFPTYTPVAGDKLYFSVYNPNGAGPGQIQFEYTSNPGDWQWGDNVTYEAGSLTGWVEYSIDLTSHVGNQINKVILMPAGGSSSVAYVDNIYFSESSTLSTNSVEIFSETVFFDKTGRVNFTKDQINTSLRVFDLMGRLILNERINGKISEKSISKSGVYILQIENENTATSIKKLFFQ